MFNCLFLLASYIFHPRPRYKHRFPLILGPFPGSFLAPDWFNLHKYIHQPEQFLLYRINGNDPLNSPKRLQNTGNTYTNTDRRAMIGQVRLYWPLIGWDLVFWDEVPALHPKNFPLETVLRFNQAKLNPSSAKSTTSGFLCCQKGNISRTNTWLIQPLFRPSDRKKLICNLLWHDL